MHTELRVASAGVRRNHLRDSVAQSMSVLCCYVSQWYRWLDGRFAGKSARVIAMKLPLDLGFAGPVYVSAVLCYTNLVRTGDPATCYPFWREVLLAILHLIGVDSSS